MTTLGLAIWLFKQRFNLLKVFTGIIKWSPITNNIKHKILYKNDVKCFRELILFSCFSVFINSDWCFVFFKY